MKQILDAYNRNASLICNKNVKADWDVQTDVMNETKVAIEVSFQTKKLPFKLTRRKKYLGKRPCYVYLFMFFKLTSTLLNCLCCQCSIILYSELREVIYILHSFIDLNFITSVP